MIFKIIGSNSAGNAYILENDKEALLIECGVNIKYIKRTLDFRMDKVGGCIISHEHLDHCCAAPELMNAGIKVYGTLGTLSSISSSYHRNAVIIEQGVSFNVGGFRILPFDVKHDALEPVGFLINHQETGNILFLTDSYYVKYTFKNLHNIIIEANYDQAILDERMHSGSSHAILRDRVLRSHMSIDTCKQLLRANDLTAVNNIVLIHLSDAHSNALEFGEEIKKLTGKNVHVADKGMQMDFNKIPF